MYKFSEYGIKNQVLFNKLYSDFITWCKSKVSEGTFSTYCDGEPVCFSCGCELSYRMFLNGKK